MAGVAKCAGPAVEPAEVSKLLGKAFITALLLTGTVEQAEVALLEAIGSLDLDDRPDEALMNAAVKAAIKGHPVHHASAEQLTFLPWELHAVMYLSPHLRRCFVLRILLGWSWEISARLLHLEIPQVEERTRSALVRLAYIDNVFVSVRTKVFARASRRNG